MTLCPTCGRPVKRKTSHAPQKTDGTINHIIAFMGEQMQRTGRRFVTSGEIWNQFSFLTPLEINSRMQSAKRKGKIVTGPRRATYSLPENQP